MTLFRFFDHFGLIAFVFLLEDSIHHLMRKEKNWRVYTRLTIAVVGLLVDSYLVFFYK